MTHRRHARVTGKHAGPRKTHLRRGTPPLSSSHTRDTATGTHAVRAPSRARARPPVACPRAIRTPPVSRTPPPHPAQHAFVCRNGRGDDSKTRDSVRRERKRRLDRTRARRARYAIRESREHMGGLVGSSPRRARVAANAPKATAGRRTRGRALRRRTKNERRRGARRAAHVSFAGPAQSFGWPERASSHTAGGGYCTVVAR